MEFLTFKILLSIFATLGFISKHRKILREQFSEYFFKLGTNGRCIKMFYTQIFSPLCTKSAFQVGFSVFLNVYDI